MTNLRYVQKKAGPMVLLTGLSGAGKSTIAWAVCEQLLASGIPVQVLDGDDLRKSLCKDLDFSLEGRYRNVERLLWIARLLSSHGITVLIAAIAPFQAQRNAFRAEESCAAEVYVKAPLAVCIARDEKGLYAASRANALALLTGIDSPYEEPDHPDLICDTSLEEPEESVSKVIQLVQFFLRCNV